MKREFGFKGTNEGQNQLVNCAEGKEEERKRSSRSSDFAYPRIQINGMIPDWVHLRLEDQQHSGPKHDGYLRMSIMLRQTKEKRDLDHASDWNWISFHDVWKSH